MWTIIITHTRSTRAANVSIWVSLGTISISTNGPPVGVRTEFSSSGLMVLIMLALASYWENLYHNCWSFLLHATFLFPGYYLGRKESGLLSGLSDPLTGLFNHVDPCQHQRATFAFTDE